MVSFAWGATAFLFGVGLLRDRACPAWFAAIALFGGAATVLAGAAIAYTGFSAFSMLVNMPAQFLMLLWMLALGVFLWRRAEVD